MNAIDTLETTTFSGRRLTRKQLALVQETVALYPHLSRRELSLTICELLHWETPAGTLKVDSGLTLLEALETHGVIVLPAKQRTGSTARRKPEISEAIQQAPTLEMDLDAIRPIRLELVTEPCDREAFKAYLEAHHDLGYRQPVGNYLFYFVTSEALQQRLGCLVFSGSAARVMHLRDEWIGWDAHHRDKHVNRIIQNNRFLIWPWVHVKGLASHALSLATKRIAADWLQRYAYRPVLIETFVDPTHYIGTCYQAANWQCIGQTQGRGRWDVHHTHSETVKDMYVYPLQANFRDVLMGPTPKRLIHKQYRNDVAMSHQRLVDDRFVAMMTTVLHHIQAIASAYDATWQIRKRIIHTMMLILLIFRLVYAKKSQGYGTTIDELWDNCKALPIDLGQKQSIAPSSFCVARRKLDAQVFKDINHAMIRTLQREAPDALYRWMGHRVFAVDGSKINLPRPLLQQGYKRPSEASFYPQGLLSTLYNVRTGIPLDVQLAKHDSERRCAMDHLNATSEQDIILYDRGYYSYELLTHHLRRRVHAVFRLNPQHHATIKAFWNSDATDVCVDVLPSDASKPKLTMDYPDWTLIPRPLRLVKYGIDGNMYVLGTTLVDTVAYPPQCLGELYHERWTIEEFYKTSKRVCHVEDFHAQHEQGVKQEIYATMALITLSRLFAMNADQTLNPDADASASGIASQPPPTRMANPWPMTTKTNFKHCITFVGKKLEPLLLWVASIKEKISQVILSVLKRHQTIRPHRAYERKSMKPDQRWRSSHHKTNASSKKPKTDKINIPTISMPS